MRTCVASGIQLFAAASLLSCKTSAVSPPSAGQAGTRAISEARAKSKLDPEIVELASRVSEERLSTTVQKLVAFGTRNTCADPGEPGRGVAAARDFLQGELRAIGGMEVVLHPFANSKCTPPVTSSNVIGYLRGRDPTRLIIIGGHYDSLAFSGRPESRDMERYGNSAGPAPGANDSGSQTSLVLEAARVMAVTKHEVTVAFVAFAGEEQGLVGSKALAEVYPRYFPNARLEAVLNCDIVGGDSSVNDEVALHQFRIYAPGAPRETGRSADGTNDGTSPSRGLMRFVGYWAGHYVPAMVAVPRLREDRIRRGGDHSSFIAVGRPAVRFIETQENVEHQHSVEDVFAHLAPGYLARMTAVVASTAAALARAPAAPTSFAAAGNTERIRFSWAEAKGAHHYAVAARPVGETYYRKRIEVAADKTAFEGSAADFGILTAEPIYVSVAAVDAAGHESLFAYPEARCDEKQCAPPPGALQVTAVVQ